MILAYESVQELIFSTLALIYDLESAQKIAHEIFEMSLKGKCPDRNYDQIEKKRRPREEEEKSSQREITSEN